jgi:hypothetical protein
MQNILSVIVAVFAWVGILSSLFQGIYLGIKYKGKMPITPLLRVTGIIGVFSLFLYWLMPIFFK